MNSREMYQDKAARGFTLIEIIVVLGIVGLLVSMVVIANTKQYTRQLSSSEESVLITSLQRARSRSMSNINAIPHGVYFGTDACPSSIYDYCYVIFEGEEFDDNPDTYEYVEKNNAVVIDSSDADKVVIFEQLSGNLDTDVEITLTNFGEETTININTMGLINW
jgi:prepilin-type N-terminal cleavage/methylation domain-containing protein